MQLFDHVAPEGYVGVLEHINQCCGMLFVKDCAQLKRGFEVFRSPRPHVTPITDGCICCAALSRSFRHCVTDRSQYLSSSRLMESDIAYFENTIYIED